MRPAIHFAPFVALAAVAGSLVAFGGTREATVPMPDDAPEPVPAPGATVGPARATAVDEADSPEDSAGDEDPGDPDDTDDRGESERDGLGATLAETPDGGKHKPPRGGCPSTMVRSGNFCIDRYEAPNRRGARPFVMQSANDANSWCTDHHKRLCTEDEWIGACQGEEHRTYPYGNEHVDGRCNDDKPWQKVDEALLAKWPAPEAKAHAKDVYQATPSGSKRQCKSEAGARDMTGNVEEWVRRTRDHANDYPYILIGCYWAGCYGGNKPTCHSTNNAHGPEFRFYETGFRCCKDASGVK